MELKGSTARPSVFEYEDYRRFLSDLYHFYKNSSRHFSFRYFSKKAGFASPNFLKLVMDGKRNISPDSVTRFSDALKLNKSEADFFLRLVNFNQAKSPSERAAAATSVTQAKGFAKIFPLHQAEFAYYANWYYIPIREMVSFATFNEDPVWIASQLNPNINELEAARAIKDLLQIGLLKRNEAGRLVQTQRSLNTANEVTSASIVQYHKDMMQLAAASIDNVPRMEREISAACVPVSKITAQKMKLKIQQFREELLAIANEDTNPETICQINIQMFPLSSIDEVES
jgi:uncharacterized protein (TIGR02147 family)